MTTFIATTPSYGHPSALRRKLGFAPLCGAAATPMAALKTPVAPEEGTTLDAFLADLMSDIQEKTTGRITAPRAVSRV